MSLAILGEMDQPDPPLPRRKYIWNGQSTLCQGMPQST
jgi:hypothetical protein